MKVSLVAVAAVVVTLSLSSVVLADDLADLDIFTTAGIFYENANYDEAAQTYQHLVGLGYEDATLYYNLANSHYKSEDMGRAVLNYLRARRLAPFDEDITANLAFVRKQLDNPNSQEAATPVFVQISELAPWITFNQSAVATLLSWLILGLLAVLYLWGRRFRKAIALRQFAAVAILCIFVFGAFAIGKHADRLHWEQIAVVTAETTGVFGGPTIGREARFNLEAGSEVRLVETLGAWSKIAIFDSGVEGWIASSDAERVLEPRG